MVGSCTKYLDVKPVGQLIPSKVEELENLLNNTNTLENHFVDNNQGSFYAFLGDNLRISDNQIKYLYTNTHPNVDRYAAYTFYHPYTDPNKPQWVWNNGVYRATALFNTVVDEVENGSRGYRTWENYYRPSKSRTCLVLYGCWIKLRPYVQSKRQQ